jgi:hypothetical protein
VSLRFKIPQSHEEWDKYVFKLKNYSFLLSSARHQYLLDYSNTFRFLLFDDDEFVGILEGSFGKLKIFGNYLECKHNPMLIKDLDVNRKEKILRSTFEKLRTLAKEKKCFFIRLSPLIKEDKVYQKIYREFNAQKAPIHNRDAMITQHINTTKPLKQLHSEMNKSSRSKVNQLKMSEDTNIEVTEDMSMFKIFKDFYLQTKQSKGFSGKTIKKLENELQYQSKANMLYFVTVYTNKKPVTIWQLVKFGKYMHLYQAASDFNIKERKSRLIYWSVLKLCKELGVKTLDLFGGMVPEGYKNKNHPWQGIYHFKQSLGGKKVTYMHHRDIPLSPFYRIYSIYSEIQEKRRGYTTQW